jgi:hypothetical protein
MPERRPIDEREQAALALYVGLMEEAKVRFYVIDMAISGRTGLPVRGVRLIPLTQVRLYVVYSVAGSHWSVFVDCLG